MKASGESDSPDKADSKDKKPGSAYKLYAVRWYILAVVAMLNLTNAMVWISFAPIANYTDEFYGDDSNTFLSLIFMVVSIPFGFLAMWFVDRMGLKLGIWTGGFLSCAGGVIRVVSSISKVPHSARLAVVIVANPLGILCAMLISPAIVDASLATSKWEDQMLIMNVVFAALAGGVAVMCLFVTRSEPPSPPTSSAAQEPSSFKDGFVACWRNRSFVVLMICLGGGVGLFSAMYTLIQQVMCVKGYSNTFSGICGALLIVGGLIGSAIAGLFVDKTKMFKEVIKVCYLLAAATACAFAVLTNYPNMKVGLAILCTGFGFFGFALYPVGLEAGVECTFPTAEATSSGLIVISGQVIGIVILLVMQMVLSFDLKNSADWSIEVCSAIYFRQVIGIVILLVMQMVLSFDLKNSADWSIEVCSAGGASGVVPVTNMMPATLFWAAVACAFAIGVTLFFNPKYKRLAHERKLEKEAKRAQNIAEATANPGTIIILPDNIGTYGSTDELSTPVAGRRELPDGDDEVTIRGRDNRNFVPDEPEKF